MFAFRVCAGAALLTLLLGGVASAESVSITACDMGRYVQNINELGHHDSGNTDYLVGRLIGNTNVPTDTFRNFFVFDLSEIDGIVTGAKLVVNTLENAGTDGYYQLSDVLTEIPVLTDGGYGKGGIFADLGAGMCYGGCSLLASQSNTTVEIPLNSDFVAAANAAIGSRLAIGGAMTTLDDSNDQYFFGNLDPDNPPPLGNAQLVVQVVPVPEPGTVALLLAGAIGIAAFTGRRRVAQFVGIRGRLQRDS
jgi:hypothetical protein